MLPLICLLQGLNKVLSDQKQPPEVFYKKGVLKNIAKIHRKTPVPKSFFNKVAGFYEKRDTGTGVCLWILQNF